MRRFAVLLALPLVLAACGARETGEGGACSSALLFNGSVYAGEAIDRDREIPPRTAVVGQGVLPACLDAPPHTDEDEEVDVARLEGVPESAAVQIAGLDDGSVFLNVDVPTEVADHPLRGVVAPRAAGVRARGEPCVLTGRVGDRFEGLVVDGRVVTVVAGTEIAGFDRDGLPHLSEGDRVRVEGRGCDRRRLVAERIEPQP